MVVFLFGMAIYNDKRRNTLNEFGLILQKKNRVHHSSHEQQNNKWVKIDKWIMNNDNELTWLVYREHLLQYALVHCSAFMLPFKTLANSIVPKYKWATMMVMLKSCF